MPCERACRASGPVSCTITDLFSSGDFAILGASSSRRQNESWDSASTQAFEELFPFLQLLQHHSRLFEHRRIFRDRRWTIGVVFFGIAALLLRMERFECGVDSPYYLCFFILEIRMLF